LSSNKSMERTSPVSRLLPRVRRFPNVTMAPMMTSFGS
jgi:hypothetical protein